MKPIDWRKKANPQLELLLKVRTKDAKPIERPEGTPYTPEEIAAWNREAEDCSTQQPYDKYKEKLSEDIVDDKNKKYIYESPDGGKTIYRREFQKSEREVVKDWKKQIGERKEMIEKANKNDKEWSGRYEDFTVKEEQVDERAKKNLKWYESWKKDNLKNEG